MGKQQITPDAQIYLTWRRSFNIHPPRPGRSAVWLAHLTGGQGAEGSNPFAPTIFFSKTR